jgi:Peptidase M50B-like
MEATQAPLSGTETVLIGLVVSALLLPSATWGLIQHFQTMAHEGMHWAVGSLSGRKAWWIELKPNGDGGTLVLPDRGFGYLVVVFAGRQRYADPQAMGAGVGATPGDDPGQGSPPEGGAGSSRADGKALEGAWAARRWPGSPVARCSAIELPPSTTRYCPVM